MKVITNKQLIRNITIFLTIISIIAIFISTIYIKKAALYTLAEDDAHKTSELIFETMNTRMQEGWGKDDLVTILKKLEHIRTGMSISSYRSEKVEEILGVVESDKKIVNSDKYIQEAMDGKKQFLVLDNGSVRYLYPIKVKQECITCHYNTKEGDINGVLDIQYPPNEIKISLDNFAVYFIVFFIIFILLSFYIFSLIINKKIINPIVNFTTSIEKTSANTHLDKEVNIETNIKEVHILKSTFNHLLKRIKFYYDKLLENLYTDDLTSLPNIVKLQEDIKKGEKYTLMIINIDSFREINSFYGVKVGDSILKQVANYLIKDIKFPSAIYRLYGDEFAILTQVEIPKEMCFHIVFELNNKIFKYNNTEINVYSSIGVVFNENERIIEKATIAVKNAKNKKTLFEGFDNSKELQEEYINHITWTKNIKEALQNDAITTYYQPIKSLESNKIVKYECLARLYQEDDVFTPEIFMDVARKSRQYNAITRKVISTAFEYFKDKENIEFSLNLSLSDITDKQTHDYLFYMLAKYKIGSKLVIEILETEEIDNFDLINDFIHKLKEYKVKVAIDDFGSGYSNFSYIVKLHVDFLKIDSSLIENIHKDEDSKVIVKTVVDFAKSIGIKTIAEKVHSKEIEDILKEMNVDFAQGYYIGKPKKEIIKNI